MDLIKFAEELKILAENNSIPYYTVDMELIELFYRQDKSDDKYLIGCSSKCINTFDFTFLVL